MRKTEEYEMIPGNVNKNVMHPRRDLQCYKVLCESRIVDPRQPTYVTIRKRIVCFRQMDYRAYFESTPTNNIGYMKAMGFSNCELIWDPCTKEAKELAQKVEAERRAAWEAQGGGSETKAKESKRKATIGDIERLSK
jgi:hypothetical protein